MGTRSIIAEPTDNGFRGRYAHWDGYPTAMGRNLWLIIARDGLDKAIAALIKDNTGWSRIGPDLADNRVNVAGYGEAYLPPDPDDWWDQTFINAGIEWAYVLNRKAVSILRPDPDHIKGWEHVGDLPYDQEPTEAALTAIECGAKFERCTHFAWAHVAGMSKEDRRTMRGYIKTTAKP